MEPVFAQGGAKKKVKVRRLPSSSPVLDPEKENTVPPYPGEVNLTPAVMQPVGQPIMFPAYPPAGFLPPLFSPWSHAVPPAGVRPGLYPDVSVVARVDQDGQAHESSVQPGAGVVNAGSQGLVVHPGDLCAGEVKQDGATRMMNVNGMGERATVSSNLDKGGIDLRAQSGDLNVTTRERRVDNNPELEKGGINPGMPCGDLNVTTREGRVDNNPEPGIDLRVQSGDLNVNTRERRVDNNPELEKGGINLGMPRGDLNVTTREGRVDNNPELEKGEINVEAVYENIADATENGTSAEHVSRGQEAHVKQSAVLDEYTDRTPKQTYRKTPFPPPSSSVPGGSSPAFEVRLSFFLKMLIAKGMRVLFFLFKICQKC